MPAESMSKDDRTSQPDNTSPALTYGRIVLKLSGESFQGSQGFGIDAETVHSIAHDIKEVYDLGVRMAIIVGGGNIFRGTRQKSLSIDRATGDYMGMLATVINGLALQDALEKQGVVTRLLSAIEMHQVAEPFIRRRAMRHLEKGRVVIFAAGTGNPFFTTDTAAALRAAEMSCNAMLKGTQVDGVYSADPKKDASATRYEKLSYHEVLARDLQVMDASAVSLSRENRIPIIVFSIHDRGSLSAVLRGEGRCTIIEEPAAQ